MAEPADDIPQSKRPALVTYEKVVGLEVSLTRIDQKVSGVLERLDSIGNDHNDHEVRIRALELTQAQFIAASASRQGVAAWVWMAIFTVVNTGLALLNYLGTPN